MPEPDWDAIDRVRLARHEQLLKIWHELPAEELLADLVVLAQLAAFQARQAQIVADARLAVETPLSPFGQGVCQLCGRKQS